MKCKKNNSKSSWKQLDLPFGSSDSSKDQIESCENQIICLVSKINENLNNKEKLSRERSVNRLINYAEKLNW